MGSRTCFIVIDHTGDQYFDDVVEGIRTFCPDAGLVWYDSGAARSSSGAPPRLAASRPLAYAKITPFFFDLFEWAVDQPYDYVVNIESDLALIADGFEQFVATAMRDLDYMAPLFRRGTAATSRWRPFHSLRPELPELRGILGTSTTNQAFSPAQIFSTRYVNELLSSRFYPELRAFVERNQAPGRSFTLQEVLLPTLADVLGLAAAGYPEQVAAYNRYRPYHSVQSVRAAQRRGDVHLVHPVRRDSHHPARQFVRSLYGLPCRGRPEL
jgi:hypothetical protein